MSDTAVVKTAKAAKPAKEKPVKEPKGKIRLRDRFTKGNILHFLGRLFIYILLIEIAFIIIYPLMTKFSAALMSKEDMFDRTVTYIPRNPTLENITTVLTDSYYGEAVLNTFLVSALAAILQTMVCSFTGYGLAKLRGRLSKIVFGLVVLNILIPPQVILVPLYLKFRFFNPIDFFGLLQLTGHASSVIPMMNSILPVILLSITGYGFKNGLYIFIMRQFYKGVPEEIEEAAAIDGYGTIQTYFRIVLPMAVPMMITIFMFAFSWQWTDTFYSGIFFSSKFKVLANTIFTMRSAFEVGIGGSYNTAVLLHTGVLLAIAPLILIYVVAQRWIIAGIERSGLVG
jgi:multiple sugar transport system permease protein